jgi:hypothetical protein
LKDDWFQPLRLSSVKLVSDLAFECNLCRYIVVVRGRELDDSCTLDDSDIRYDYIRDSTVYMLDARKPWSGEKEHLFVLFLSPLRIVIALQRNHIMPDLSGFYLGYVSRLFFTLSTVCVCAAS